MWSASVAHRNGEVHANIALRTRLLEEEVLDFLGLGPTGDRLTHVTWTLNDFSINTTLSPDWPSIDTLRGHLQNLTHLEMRSVFTHNLAPSVYVTTMEWIEKFTPVVFTLLDEVSQDLTNNDRADLSLAAVFEFHILFRGFCAECVRRRLCDAVKPFFINGQVHTQQPTANSMEWNTVRTPTDNALVRLEGYFHIVETDEPLHLPCSRPRCEPH